ncbi:MAG: hypothetical protein KBA46_08165 [Candidatus Omnitrophica bacterium]|nr:hypothetical protein [Candidatus Omnitrophota bacterium]
MKRSNHILRIDKMMKMPQKSIAVITILTFATFAFAQDVVEMENEAPKQESVSPVVAQEVKAVEQSVEELAALKEKEELARLKAMPLEQRLYQRISLDLRNMDAVDALKYIAGKGALNTVFSRNVSGRVTLTLEDVPLKDVFDLVLRLNALAYIMQGDVFNIMTEAEYKALYGVNFTDLRKVKVFRLKYAVPEQAFSLLDALKSEVGRVLVDQESGNVLLMETPDKLAQMEEALAEFERQYDNTVRVFVLKYAKAKEVEEILRTRLDAKKVGVIKADERSNSVIVQTLSDRMNEIERLIARLDDQTREVLVETKIIKIKLSDQLNEGLEWEGIFSYLTYAGPVYFGSTPFATNTAGSNTPSFTSRSEWYQQMGGNINSYPFSGTTSSLNSSVKTTAGEKMHFGMIQGDKDFDVLFNFLKTLGDTRVLANPRIVVTNNQEAKIHIGERQAYVTTTTTTGQTTSTIAEEVQFVDVGIKLAVTPTINEDGFITMKVKPEVSTVSSILITPTNNKIPIIDTSLAETTVMMKDNTTLLIGGLRKEEKQDSYEKLPVVGDLPIVGKLFKSGSKKVERTELLVMITPHIITGKKFDLGDERAFGDKVGQDVQRYQPLTPDKTLMPPVPGLSSGIQPKPYRDYLTLKDTSEGELILKGHKEDAE